jgi:hypothetical protein
MHPSCTNNSVRALKKKRFGGCLLKLDVAAWKVLTKDQDGQGCKMEEKPRQHGQALIDEQRGAARSEMQLATKPNAQCRQAQGRKLSPCSPEFLGQLGTATAGIN